MSKLNYEKANRRDIGRRGLVDIDRSIPKDWIDIQKTKKAKRKEVKAKKPADKNSKPKLISNGICTKCGLKAKWLSVNGKWQLKNPDGTDHYDLCRETQGIGRVYVPKLIGVTGNDNKIADFEGLPW
jgi:hypothetical protein